MLNGYLKHLRLLRQLTLSNLAGRLCPRRLQVQGLPIVPIVVPVFGFSQFCIKDPKKVTPK